MSTVCACGRPIVVWWQHLGQRRVGYCSTCAKGLRDLPIILYELTYENPGAGAFEQRGGPPRSTSGVGGGFHSGGNEATPPTSGHGGELTC